jgi:hypothetical protein
MECKEETNGDRGGEETIPRRRYTYSSPRLVRQCRSRRISNQPPLADEPSRVTTPLLSYVFSASVRRRLHHNNNNNRTRVTTSEGRAVHGRRNAGDTTYELCGGRIMWTREPMRSGGRLESVIARVCRRMG